MTTQHDADDLYTQYLRLQRYVGWCEDDARNVCRAREVLVNGFGDLIDDFYRAIEEEPLVAAHISGGTKQINRLKKTLHAWLQDLFSGQYDEAYVQRRWQIGRKHVEIGLRQVYADAALARLRFGLIESLETRWQGEPKEVLAISRSINRLLDLELALIEDAYTTQRVFEERDTVRRQTEETFRKLVESARCVILILRTEGTTTYFNPFAERVTGFSNQEVTGQRFDLRFLPQSERPVFDEAIARAANDSSGTLGFESSIACRDGQQRRVLWNAQYLDDYDGEPAILAVGHDITELKEAQQRLMQAERLAAIGQTVAGLAHESRNAFQRSQACLEMLTLEVEGNDSALSLVQRIQRALDHLHHLYEEVRDYAAPIVLDRQPVDLRQLWRDAWAQLDVVRQGKSIELKELTQATNFSSNVDWFQFGQVFRNIFENAISAIGDGGRVTVQGKRLSSQEEAKLEITISDSGSGISSDLKNRIFDPFFTTKTKGTGLGLAIVKRIVETHGGTITLRDNKPGAQFVLTLDAFD